MGLQRPVRLPVARSQCLPAIKLFPHPPLTNVPHGTAYEPSKGRGSRSTGPPRRRACGGHAGVQYRGCCRGGLTAALPLSIVASTKSDQGLQLIVGRRLRSESTRELTATTGGRTQRDRHRCGWSPVRRPLVPRGCDRRRPQRESSDRKSEIRGILLIVHTVSE